MSKKNYYFSGTTPEGKVVMHGAYFFTATTGVPLTELLYIADEHNAVVNWHDYLKV